MCRPVVLAGVLTLGGVALFVLSGGATRVAPVSRPG
jgi:hypothetical protein